MALFFPAEDNSLSQKKKVTVEDLFSEDFKVRDPEAKWISGESETCVQAGTVCPSTVLAAWLALHTHSLAVKVEHRALAVIVIL